MSGGFLHSDRQGKAAVIVSPARTWHTPPMTRQSQSIPLPAPAPGTRRELVVHRWGTPGARPKAYLQAALHADEWPGLLALHHLGQRLDELDTQDLIVGEVVILPYANPIGMDQSANDSVLGRYRLADGGGNFNRDWPDLAALAADGLAGRFGNDADANVAMVRAVLLDTVAALPDTTEREAHQKALLGLSVDADYVLDVHCDWRATMHLYANHDRTETVAELGRDLAAPVILLEDEVGEFPFDDANSAPWRELRRRFGLDRETLPSACFSVTVELRGQQDVTDAYAAADAGGILNFLIRRGVIAGDPPPLPEATGEPTPLDHCDRLQAPHAGLIVWHAELGQRVAKGDAVADVIDIAEIDPAKARTPVISRQNGILFSMHVDALTRPGAVIGKIAGAEPIERRPGEKLLSNR